MSATQFDQVDRTLNALKFLRGKVTRREANLSPEVLPLLSEQQCNALLDSIQRLNYLIAIIERQKHDIPAIVRQLMEYRDQTDDHDGMVATIDEVLQMLPIELERATSVQRRQMTTQQFINSLFVDGRPTLIAVDLDETIMTSIQNSVAQLTAMVDRSIEPEVRASIDRTIRTAQLQKFELDQDKVGPNNLARLVELSALPNVTVVILTKRNPEGVREIEPLIRSVLPGIQVIGTINADGHTVEKNIVIRDLARAVNAEVLHFADDSEPHRLAVETEFKNSQDSNSTVDEVWIYEVDLKAQLTAPVVAILMSSYGD